MTVLYGTVPPDMKNISLKWKNSKMQAAKTYVTLSTAMSISLIIDTPSGIITFKRFSLGRLHTFR